MIQRIQTVYLALVLIFSFVSLLSPMGEWYLEGTLVADFSNFTFNIYDKGFESCESSGPYCLGILLILVMFLSLMSIMLFRKRMRQLRLTILSTIFLVGYAACYALFAFKYNLSLETFAGDVQALASKTPEFSVPFLGILPIFSIILNVLAIIAIRKDEALVRSLDRLR